MSFREYPDRPLVYSGQRAPWRWPNGRSVTQAVSMLPTWCAGRSLHRRHITQYCRAFGVVLACCASIVSNLGLSLQKKNHLNNQAEAALDDEEGDEEEGAEAAVKGTHTHTHARQSQKHPRAQTQPREAAEPRARAPTRLRCCGSTARHSRSTTAGRSCGSRACCWYAASRCVLSLCSGALMLARVRRLCWAPSATSPLLPSRRRRSSRRWCAHAALRGLVVTSGPQGALNLVSNVFLAPLLLGETFNWEHAAATVVIVAGSTISVAFASHQDESYTIDQLLDLFNKPTFLIYSIVVGGADRAEARQPACIWRVCRRCCIAAVLRHAHERPAAEVDAWCVRMQCCSPGLTFRVRHTESTEAATAPINTDAQSPHPRTAMSPSGPTASELKYLKVAPAISPARTLSRPAAPRTLLGRAAGDEVPPLLLRGQCRYHRRPVGIAGEVRGHDDQGHGGGQPRHVRLLGGVSHSHRHGSHHLLPGTGGWSRGSVHPVRADQAVHA
jgi:hypothetical protein